MSKVLFIKANDRPADQSISVQMYNAFLAGYKESHPEDTIIETDLYKENLPYYGNEAITALYKKNNGMPLSAEETKLTDLIDGHFEQFMEADKIVFAFPLWNSTVPAPLITYISYLSQAGKMFKYTPEGPVGMASDKKVMLLSARGGVFSEEPMASMEMALNYVKAVIRLWGIVEPKEVVIEGHNQFPDRASEIVQDGLEAAVKAAKQF